MSKQIIGIVVSIATAIYTVLCGLAYACDDTPVYIGGRIDHRTAGTFTFWHPALLVFVGACVVAVLLSLYEAPQLTRDEQDVLRRYRESL